MPLPPVLTLSSAVARGRHYQGTLAETLPQWAEAGLQPLSPVAVSLQFGRHRRQAMVDCEVEGRFAGRCERCERSFEQSYRVERQLRVVTSDEEERAALAESEPLRVDEDCFDVVAVVVQELLLEQPVVSRCDACEAALRGQPAEKVKDEGPTHRPFAGLGRQIK
jgi:uncharacterized protein